MPAVDGKPYFCDPSLSLACLNAIGRKASTAHPMAIALWAERQNRKAVEFFEAAARQSITSRLAVFLPGCAQAAIRLDCPRTHGKAQPQSETQYAQRFFQTNHNVTPSFFWLKNDERLDTRRAGQSPLPKCDMARSLAELSGQCIYKFSAKGGLLTD